MAAEYSKGRDYISSAKLNYFHYVLKQLLQYTFHPCIPTSPERRLRVADLGTQTAIWPIDVALSYGSSVELDAFDISDTFFPPPDWLPSNVRLRLHDIYDPFPSHLHGLFDVVHLRLFLTLSKVEVAKILEHASQLLAPGGFVQWTEHDKTALSVISSSASDSAHDQAAEAAHRFVEIQQHTPFPGYDSAWAASLAHTMSECGLEIMADHRVSVPSALVPQFSELHLLSLDDVPSGLSTTIDEFRDSGGLTKLRNEFAAGFGIVDGFVCVVGRKIKGLGSNVTMPQSMDC